MPSMETRSGSVPRGACCLCHGQAELGWHPQGYRHMLGLPSRWHIPGRPGEPRVTRRTSRRAKLLRGCKTVSRACHRSAGTAAIPCRGRQAGVRRIVRVRMDADKATNAFTRKIKKLTGIGSL